MFRLINANVLKLLLVKPIVTSKPLPPYHVPKAFCQYHHQLGHYTEKHYTLSNKIEDFIDNNTIS